MTFMDLVAMPPMVQVRGENGALGAQGALVRVLRVHLAPVTQMLFEKISFSISIVILINNVATQSQYFYLLKKHIVPPMFF